MNVKMYSVWWKGQWVVAQYGQWDGMPEGQGIDIYKFLVVPGNIEKLKIGLEKHTYKVTEDDLEALDAERKAWDQHFNHEINETPEYDSVDRTGMSDPAELYPSISRGAGAKILTIIARAATSSADDEEDEDEVILQIQKDKKKVPLFFNLEFANDGCFCEWAYVIDLDSEVLEIYGGCERKHDKHRFKDVGPECATVPGAYCTFTFSELFGMKTSGDFIDSINKACPPDVEED